MTPPPAHPNRRRLFLASQLAAWVVVASGCRQLLDIEERGVTVSSGGASGTGGSGGIGATGGGTTGGGAGTTGGGQAGDGGQAGESGAGGGGESGAAGVGGAAPSCPALGKKGDPCVEVADGKPVYACGEGPATGPCAGRKCVGAENTCRDKSLSCAPVYGACVAATDEDCGLTPVTTLGLWPMARYCSTGIARSIWKYGSMEDAKKPLTGPRIHAEFAAAPTNGTADPIVSSPIVASDGSVLVVSASGRIHRLPPPGEGNREAIFEAGTNQQDAVKAGVRPTLAIVANPGSAAGETFVLATYPEAGAKVVVFDDTWFSASQRTVKPPQANLGSLTFDSFRYQSSPVSTNDGTWVVAQAKTADDLSKSVLLLIKNEATSAKSTVIAVLDDSTANGVAVLDDQFVVSSKQGNLFAGKGTSLTIPAQLLLMAKADLETPTLVKVNGTLHAIAVGSGRLWDVNIPATPSATPTATEVALGYGNGKLASVSHSPALRRDGRLVFSGEDEAKDAARLTLTFDPLKKQYQTVVDVLPNGTDLFATVLGTHLAAPLAEPSSSNLPTGETLLTPFVYDSKLQKALRVSATSESGVLQWSTRLQDLNKAPAPPKTDDISALRPAVGLNGSVYFTGTDGKLHELSAPLGRVPLFPRYRVPRPPMRTVASSWLPLTLVAILVALPGCPGADDATGAAGANDVSTSAEAGAGGANGTKDTGAGGSARNPAPGRNGGAAGEGSSGAAGTIGTETPETDGGAGAAGTPSPSLTESSCVGLYQTNAFWPAAGRCSARQGSSASSGPTKFAFLAQADTGAAIVTSPVIDAAGNVYVVNAKGLARYDAGLKTKKVLYAGGPITAAPVILESDRIVVLTEAGGLLSFPVDGTEAETIAFDRTEKDESTKAGWTSSLAVSASGLLTFASPNGNVYIVNPGGVGGEAVGTTDVSGLGEGITVTTSSVTISAAGDIVVGTNKGLVVLASGFTTQPLLIPSAPVSRTAVFLAGKGAVYADDAGSVHTVTIAVDGTATDTIAKEKLGAFPGAPAVLPGNAAQVFLGDGALLRLLDGGDAAANVDTLTTALSASGPIVGAAATDSAGQLFVPSTDGNIYFSRRSTSADTEFDVVDSFLTEASIVAAPALAENRLYVGSTDKFLYLISDAPVDDLTPPAPQGAP